jgi:hypothetical protein
MAHVELGPRVKRDLREARRAGELGRAREAFEDLGAEVDGLDIVALQGRSPWRRRRTGHWRVLFRPLEPAEMRDLGRRGRGYFVARFVNRRDLDEAVDAL